MDDWRTYDRVAETYERVHANRFAEVARDLLAMAQLPDGARVLDVGTGTGVTAEVADAAGHRATGIDESVGMLLVGRRTRPRLRLVGAQAIDLPFRDGAFDAAIGTFVLAHFTKYQTALFDIRRVLGPAGRVAFSSWADGVDAYQETWRGLIESVVPREMLETAYAQAAPWHAKFRRREAIEEVLIEAGMRHVRTEVAKYHWTYGRDEYLDGLEVWATGRFAREMLGERGWAEFRSRAAAAFSEQFPDPLNDFREVILGVATKG